MTSVSRTLSWDDVIDMFIARKSMLQTQTFGPGTVIIHQTRDSHISSNNMVTENGEDLVNISADCSGPITAIDEKFLKQ